jgi:uncharacterized heparinase superfamily protein
MAQLLDRRQAAPRGLGMSALLLAKIRRGVRLPPRVLMHHVVREFRAEADRVLSPWHVRGLSPVALLRALEAASLDELWVRLASQPYFCAALAPAGGVSPADFDALCPGAAAAVAAAAERALAHRVNLLGSGPVDLGVAIDWHCDFKTGHRWPPAYFSGIDYNNFDLPSDVKVPWELSRLQWLIPAGQQYLLTGDERYAAAVRDILRDWIAANPYAHSVNWACTMEVALRILVFTWLFRVFHASSAWRRSDFRYEFLASLYMHARFTERHLERSDVNGNHFTADAAGLVFAGLFFGRGAAPARWSALGWRLLSSELPRQVYPDGVDFEASVPYHRLVQELFLFPALYRTALGLDVAAAYRERLVAMARFTAAYIRPDGSVPLWGDADDARALPFGTQALNDHRYLLGLGAFYAESGDLRRAFSGPLDEIYWILGPGACRRLADSASAAAPSPSPSIAFPDGGFFVMRNGRDHVFIDCGPVGLAGRGGHGHNDCLSFAAVLDGVPLVADCGAYLYTASPRERNFFRSTEAHNTPRVDRAEINRFIAPDSLWTVHYDAVPDLRAWRPGAASDEFVGAHSGYRRLSPPVVPVRQIVLDHASHSLRVVDRFETPNESQGGPRAAANVAPPAASHEIEIPLHLEPGVTADVLAPGHVRLAAGARLFDLQWGDPLLWSVAVESARVSPSYGLALPSRRLVWRRSGPLAPLRIEIAPSA